MACLRLGFAIAISLLLFAAPTSAADQPSAPTPAFYDRPVLVIDPGMHTNAIWSAAADVEGGWAATGSDDKTVRVWSLLDGALVRTIRLPAGTGKIGELRAMAMSPVGALIAAGGWTRATDADPQEQIYLFDRASGALRRRIEGLTGRVFRLTFSPDGQLLAATLYVAGLRIYARDRDWAEVARDDQYDRPSYGAVFASDGRLATTEFEGKVRLYAGPLRGDIRPTVTIAAPGSPGTSPSAPTRIVSPSATTRFLRPSTSWTGTPSPRCRGLTSAASKTALSRGSPGPSTARPCSQRVDT